MSSRRVPRVTQPQPDQRPTNLAESARLDVDSTVRPRLLNVVIGGYIGTAILNLLVGVWTLAFLPGAIDAVKSQGRVLSEGGVILSFALVAVAALTYSIAIVALALRLRRGHSWARPTLLTISALSLVAIVTGGTPGAAVILLMIVLDVMVTRRPVTEWLRAKHRTGALTAAARRPTGRTD